MSKKKIILLNSMLMLIPTISMATDGAYDSVSYLSKVVLNILSWFGYAVAFGMLMWIGIKYMLSAANEKADLKGNLKMYIIGIIFIFCCSTIAKTVAEIPGDKETNSPGGIVDKGFELGGLVVGDPTINGDANIKDVAYVTWTEKGDNIAIHAPEDVEYEDYAGSDPVITAPKEVNGKKFLYWEVYKLDINGNPVGSPEKVYDNNFVATGSDALIDAEWAEGALLGVKTKYELIAVYEGDASFAGNGGPSGSAGGAVANVQRPAGVIPPEALADSTFKTLIDEAEKYLGFPYVWGGSSPETSFDCSGFVCYVFKNSGVYPLSRTTAQGIYNQCTTVSKDEAKPGDLIFFTGTYKTSSPVTHIGIYVGNGQMLHCGDPISYTSVDSDYWSSHFYAYGRLGN